MSSYADMDNIKLILNSIIESISDQQLEYAVNISNNWIEGQVSCLDPENNTPDLIQQASELYASSFLLRLLYDTDSTEAQTAVWYETTAKDLVDRFVGQNPSCKNYECPYTYNLTPKRTFMKRNLRTVYDTDIIDGINENEWNTEK